MGPPVVLLISEIVLGDSNVWTFYSSHFEGHILNNLFFVPIHDTHN